MGSFSRLSYSYVASDQQVGSFRMTQTFRTVGGNEAARLEETSWQK
jgi:hypothetical protein